MKWKVIKSEYTFNCPWIKVRKDHVILPSGIEIDDFYVTELPDWVNVIAITKDDEYIIEEQYRHGIQKVCYELCAGNVAPDETPLDAAQRELLEETGYTGGEWTFLGDFVPNASGSNNVCHTFLAIGVEKTNCINLDKTEDIILHLISEQEIKTILLNNLMPEGVMAAPLWRYLANK